MGNTANTECDDSLELIDQTIESIIDFFFLGKGNKRASSCIVDKIIFNEHVALQKFYFLLQLDFLQPHKGLLEFWFR